MLCSPTNTNNNRYKLYYISQGDPWQPFEELVIAMEVKRFVLFVFVFCFLFVFVLFFCSCIFVFVFFVVFLPYLKAISIVKRCRDLDFLFVMTIAYRSQIGWH